MKSLLDGVPGGIAELSADLRIVRANDSLAAMAGTVPEELAGQPFDRILSAASRILFQTHVAPVVYASGRVEEVFLALATPPDAPTPVLLNVAPRARVASGPGSDDPTYVALVVRVLARGRWEIDLVAAHREMQQQKEANEHLAEAVARTAADLAARYEAEQQGRVLRDAFIAVVSHELRTPITTIYGMSQVLRRGYEAMPPEMVGQYVGDIEAEADRLRRLAEDLLVLSRAEGGRLEVVDEPLVLEHVVRRTVRAEASRRPGHTFLVDPAERLPLVRGEELSVEQVLGNLLSNAAKYSPTGSTVRVAMTQTDGGVTVRVLDAGPGIPAEAEDRLFDLFYRAPDAIRKTAGAGIGLFVCRQLVEAMGGRIWARRRRDVGSEFGFWLPALDGGEDGEPARDGATLLRPDPPGDRGDA